MRSPLRKKLIGHCIYCGESSGKLRDEHPIPDAIGGDLLLVAACCKACEERINPFEQRVLRNVWGPARSVIGRLARRKTKRPQALARQLDASGKLLLVNAKASQTALVMLQPDGLPGLMRTRSHPGWQKESIILRFLSLNRDRSFKGQYEQSIGIPLDYYRLIAKMAYGIYYYCYWTGSGLKGNHTPIIQNFILSGDGNFRKYIGSSESRKRNPESLHKWGFQCLRYPDREFIAIEIQPFSSIQSQAYWVVVSELKFESADQA